MALFERSLEPLAAIGCGLAAAAAGSLDAGLAAGAAVGIAGLIARVREGCARHGLDEPELMRTMQKTVLRKWDRYDTTQEERDIITLADVAMAKHLPACMLDRSELADTSVDADEPYPQKASRLIADQLAELDPMFAAPASADETESLARRFARHALECAYETARQDKDYAVLFTVDLLLAGNRAHATTHSKLDAILAEIERQARPTGVPEETVLVIARRVAETVDDVDDVDGAVAQIHAAIDELLILRNRAARGSNLGGLADEALRRMAERNARNQFDDAAEVGATAYADLLMRQRAERGAIADAMIAQSRVRIDAEAVALWTEERLRVDQAELKSNHFFEEIQRWRAAGDRYGLPLEYNVTILLSERALSLARNVDEQCWTRIAVGIAKYEKGERTGGAAGLALFSAAVETFETVLRLSSEIEFPDHWAAAQTNLGIVQRSLGSRLGGREGLRLQRKAVAAHESALRIHTEEDDPANWALVMSNLGVALKTQSDLTSGEARVQLLSRAVATHQAALRVRTERLMPADWAVTQNNLGIALETQGLLSGGDAGHELLDRAVAAFEATLRVRSEIGTPADWAISQHNLGGALANQGCRLGGEAGFKLLEKSARAYEAALRVRSEKDTPITWAETQHDLGQVRAMQAEFSDEVEELKLLHDAASSHISALRVFTEEAMPAQWAKTQDHLGQALLRRGRRMKGEIGASLLSSALESFYSTLRVNLKKDRPNDWATTLEWIGFTHFTLSQITDENYRLVHLRQAEAAYAESLTVYTHDSSGAQFERRMNFLGRLRSTIANIEEDR